MTAAIYAARKKMDFLVITKEVGGQTNWTKNVENYAGFSLVSGGQLAVSFREHLKQYGVTAKEGETVTEVGRDGNAVAVRTNKGEYLATAAIIASGKIPRILGVEGENRLRNKGLAYCATCDAPLFAGMDVAVVGGGNSALGAVIQLAGIAKKVFLIIEGKKPSADPVMTEKALAGGKTELIAEAKVTRILGDRFVSGIALERGGKAEELAVEGVFVETGSVPSSDFAKGVDRNEKGEILVNSGSETSLPGVFAAGDVTNVPAKQIIVACGEGAKAAIAAFDYVNRNK